ncbi:hypothetical protein GCM10027035_25480 [Emticicia sediminis]
MENKTNTSKDSLQGQSKDKQHLDQFQKVFNEYFKQPFTMKMVSVNCNIDRANICWYNRDLRRLGRIKAVRKGICPITKHRAIYWTTNPQFFPKESQLNIFENESKPTV